MRFFECCRPFGPASSRKHPPPRPMKTHPPEENPASALSSKLADQLAQAAADYQNETVIPHCPTCGKPCCKLDSLVLEMDWRELKTIWQIKESRKEFDQHLAEGNGPEEIRPANGFYYAHKKICPAYAPAEGGCRVYNQDVKPPGCSDFPVYENEGELMVDLRCEAVDVEALAEKVAQAVGAEYRLVKTVDEQFSFLVTFGMERVAKGK